MKNQLTFDKRLRKRSNVKVLSGQNMQIRLEMDGEINEHNAMTNINNMSSNPQNRQNRSVRTYTYELSSSSRLFQRVLAI